MAGRFSRAARYHSILLGRGTHRVRRGLRGIRTHQAVRGLVSSMGRRWWPGSTSADAASSPGKRRKLLSLPRIGRSAEADGNNGGEPVKRTHGTHRLVWDFAVVTAAAAVLLVLHHQFKKPFRSVASASIVAASVEPGGDQATKKPSTRRRSHTRRHVVAANADRPADSASDSHPAPSQSDAVAAAPQQSEPVPGQKDVD
ncbi:MAG TPA: hypothetical protein VMR25_01905, partial [Planctomycetaceae bacterium]|nr:hypothetical protein [Planctomycetaceae bacterium]